LSIRSSFTTTMRGLPSRSVSNMLPEPVINKLTEQLLGVHFLKVEVAKMQQPTAYYFHNPLTLKCSKFHSKGLHNCNNYKPWFHDHHSKMTNGNSVGTISSCHNIHRKHTVHHNNHLVKDISWNASLWHLFIPVTKVVWGWNYRSIRDFYRFKGCDNTSE
jgi:hypothetical protein